MTSPRKIAEQIVQDWQTNKYYYSEDLPYLITAIEKALEPKEIEWPTAAQITAWVADDIAVNQERPCDVMNECQMSSWLKKNFIRERAAISKMRGDK